ncbi:MAG TPA: phosphotransferase [Steroidobacteraceae bacterium]|nr:phosphotransferase [Steroidobacteraceae bacterium]
MIRPEDFANLLSTVRNAIAVDLRPDLQSDHIRAEAGALTLILDRLITQLRDGEAVASQRVPEWQQIRSQLHALSVGTVNDSPGTSGFMGSVATLHSGIADVQRTLSEPQAFERLGQQLKSDDRRTRAWLKQTVAALSDLAEAFEPKASTSKPLAATKATPPPDESLQLRDALNAYLHKRYPSLPSEPITRFKIVPGGHTKQTAIFAVTPNDVLPEHLVLRRDLALSITGTSVIDEFPILERVYALGLPIPKPVLVEPDSSVLDGTFMIMTEVVDAVVAGTYFPEERRLAPRNVGPDFGKEVAQVLAGLHAGTQVAEATPTTDKQKSVVELFQAWTAMEKPPASLSIDLGFAWLMNKPLPNRPRCLIHGDVGTHNILVRDGHLVALIDWELAHPADPAEDLAQCRMMLLPDTMPWDAFVREYIAAGGNPHACDDAAVAWYCIYTYLKHGLMNAKLRARYLSGARDDVIAASVASHYFERLMQYQARALQLAVSATR